MSRWQLVRPLAGRNLVTNPSFEVDTTGWAGQATGTIDAVTPPAGSVGLVWGKQIGSVGLNAASGDGAYFAITLAQATTYYFRAWFGAFGAYTVTAAIIRTDTSATVASEALALTVLPNTGYRFQEIAFSFTTPATTGFHLRLTHTAGTLNPSFAYFMVDGVMIATADFYYLDGDQPGCVWEGAPHNSASRTRQLQAISRAAGNAVDLETEYGFYVEDVEGGGRIGPEWNVANRPAPLPGSAVLSARTPDRTLALIGKIAASTYAGLRQARNQLIQDVGPDLVPYVNGAPQPVRVRYVGDYKTLELAADYAEGLYKTAGSTHGYLEDVALRFVAHNDPYWREVGDTTEALDTVDTLAFYGVSARLNGLWSALGITSLSGATPRVRALAWGPDGKLYFGGTFTQVNAIANTAYIARYNPVLGAVEALNATALNGIVHALLFGPDHTLYVGGEFTDAGGDADADYVCSVLDAMWGGSGAYAALTVAPLNGLVRALALDSSTGYVLLGGEFTGDGVTTLNRVATWDGTDFGALGSTPGVDGVVRAIAFLNDGNNTILVGGDFSNAGGGSAPYLAGYAGGAWFAVGSSGPNGIITALAAWNDGAVVGGAFTTFDGESAPYILQLTTITAAYTGWRTMGAVATATVRALAVVNGLVYAALNSDGRQVGWFDGAAWRYADMGLFSGSVDVYALAVNQYGEIAHGGDSTGDTSVAGDTTLTLATGAAETYPIITIGRSGGSTMKVRYVGNETRQQGIWFDNIQLRDGEVLTLDCQTLALTSNLGRPLAVMPGSVPLTLGPGPNLLTVFVYVPAGSTPTAECSIRYRPAYASYDAGDDV